jgi:hypothetical protein
MGYKGEKWIDHVVTNPGVYTAVDNGDGTWTLTEDFGAVITQGTPLSSTKMNSLERRLAMMDEFEGDRDETDWTDGLPTEKRWYEDKTPDPDLLIKKKVTTWTDGLPTQQVYYLYYYDDDDNLVATVTATVTKTWTNGLPTANSRVIVVS